MTKTNSVTVTIEEPNKKNYYYKCDADGKLQCDPVRQGFGCYGDCNGCFSRHEEMYERFVKMAEKQNNSNKDNNLVCSKCGKEVTATNIICEDCEFAAYDAGMIEGGILEGDN